MMYDPFDHAQLRHSPDDFGPEPRELKFKRFDELLEVHPHCADKNFLEFAISDEVGSPWGHDLGFDLDRQQVAELRDFLVEWLEEKDE